MYELRVYCSLRFDGAHLLGAVPGEFALPLRIRHKADDGGKNDTLEQRRNSTFRLKQTEHTSTSWARVARIAFVEVDRDLWYFLISDGTEEAGGSAIRAWPEFVAAVTNLPSKKL